MIQLLFNPQGRISRKTFWLVLLAFIGVSFVAGMADALIFGFEWTDPEPISTIISLLSIWPSIAISTKRLHDRSMSGWWQLVPLLILIIGFLPGHPGRNKYGHNPLEPETGDLGEVFS